MTRGLFTYAILTFGGGALLAAFAVYAFSHPQMSALAGWMLVLAAVLLWLAGFRFQASFSEQSDELVRRHSQVDLLQAQLAQNSTAVDTLADGLETAIFICDPKANIQYANRRAMEIFRFDSPVGRSILAVTLSYDLEQLVAQAAKIGTPQGAELNFTYPDERVGIAKAWPQPDGQRVFLSVYEITDLRRLERVRQDFVANVSHELRTPLTIIRAMAETLQEEPEASDEKRLNYYGRIISEVDRLSAMSNDLLILSAAELNPVRKQACNIAGVFRNVAGQLTPKAREKGLQLVYDGPDSLTIAANTAQMTQVALNLIENALNYTNEGTVTVSLSEHDGFVEIKVRDTGIGIGSEHVDRIFERFYRVDKGRTRSTGGTGLGLSIVKHIVEAHGGRLTLDSALNQGSTFTVRLPKDEVVEEA